LWYAQIFRYDNRKPVGLSRDYILCCPHWHLNCRLNSLGKGTAEGLTRLLIGTGQNPSKDLNVIETDDVINLMKNPEFKPKSDFGKSLSKREIAIMKDGTRFYNRISGFEGENALFIKK